MKQKNKIKRLLIRQKAFDELDNSDKKDRRKPGSFKK